MNIEALLSLINNAALLLALVVLYDVLFFNMNINTRLKGAVIGIFIGMIGIALMLNPWELSSGIFFDTRSILLSITALFFGLIPAVIAAVIVGFYRFYEGGAGAWPGIAVIASSVIIGLLWRHFHDRFKKVFSWSELYILGILVHIAMLICMLLLPWSIAIEVLSNVSFPVMLVYPIGTVLLGSLLNNQNSRKKAYDIVEENKVKLQSFIDNVPVGIFRTTSKGKMIQANPEMAKIVGLRTSEEAVAYFQDIGTQLYVNPDRRNEFLNILKTQGHAENFEYEALSADGNHIWLLMNARVSDELNDDGFIIDGFILNITELKNTEKVLKKTESLLYEVSSIAHIGGWEFDVSTGEGTWTSEVACIHDVDPSDETNKNIGLSFYAPSSKEIIEKAIHDAIEKGEPYDVELELISAKKIHKWVRTLGRPVFKDGNVVKLTGSMQDITERKIAADKLLESEGRFRATFEQAAVGMCQSTMEGSFIQVNKRMCDITGYSSKELLSMNFADITYPEDYPKEIYHVENILAGKINDYSIEKRYVCKDGKVVWVNLTVAIVRHQDNKPLYFIGIVEDIDKRKHAEKEVKHYNERLNMLHEIDKGIISSFSSEQIANTVLKHLRKLISCSLARLMLVDKDTDEIFVFAMDSGHVSQIRIGTRVKLNHNRQLDQLRSGRSLVFSDLSILEEPTSPMASMLVKEGICSGLSVPLIIKEEMIGILNLASFTPGFFNPDHQAIVEEVATQLSIAIRNSHLNEQVRKHTIELERYVKERTSQLEEANSELEAFTYSVSHDLRSPLRAIDGFSRIIIEDYGFLFDEEGKRLFDIIRTNTQKMDKLITDLLAFSRIGRNEMNCIDIDMNALVKSVFADLIVHEDKKVVFTVADLPGVCADPTLIRQLWTNLLSNSLKYSMRSEELIIDVGAYAENGMNVYYVKDNGVGFDPKYSHKLFGIFQRLHNEKDFEGTGVGLAIVQRIIHRHGGKAWAEGKVNEGATFYFSLPVMEKEYVCGE
ncbi:PAS domain S-box protein [Methanolobus psychrotolerans]|uniref:PAS domain S-box protein n=1 Tax=Methanolobus psychrotolerans TaxID=1874706 RepID=UPI000B917161|nr:PAS domain S-box protein [Methanolobus psychrotolerans]